MYEVWKCVNPDCGLRYSVESGSKTGVHCPRCRSTSRLLIAEMDQQSVPNHHSFTSQPTLRLEVVLDNIRSAWNVGSIFRSADGAGAACLHLCGVTPTPDHSGVKKTALGAESSLPWQYHADGVLAVSDLKAKGALVWALEGGSKALPLMGSAIPPTDSMVLVVGNELGGVDPGILELCERVVYLPMTGAKGSLNVAVAFGIAVYWLRFCAGSHSEG